MSTAKSASIPNNRNFNNKAKTRNKPARKESSIMRALRKVARLGAKAGRKAKSAAIRLKAMAQVAYHKVKAAAKRIAAKVASAVKPIAVAVAYPFVKTWQAVAGTSVITTIKSGARRAWAAVAHTWRTVLAPFLRDWGMVFAVAGWVTALFAAPLVTAVVTGTAGLIALALSKGLLRLEHSDTKLARVLRDVFEVMGQALRIAFYVGTGLAVTLMASMSLPIAMLVMMDLALRSFLPGVFSRLSRRIEVATSDVRHTSARIISAKSQALSDAAVLRVIAKEVGTKETTSASGAHKRRESEKTFSARMEVESMQASDEAMHENAITHIAKGAEELADSVWSDDDGTARECDACGVSEKGLRAVSEERSDHMLCHKCYDDECEDNALKYTGTSLKARHTVVMLNTAGIESLKAYKRSIDHGGYHWGVVSWWRDARGIDHERQWSCFVDGFEVCKVIYDHQRRGHRAMIDGELLATKRSYEAASRLAQEVVSDRRNNAGSVIGVLGAVATAGG